MPQRMAQFHKVGFEQFLADWKETFPSLIDEMDAVEVERHIREIYDNIQLPKRSTYGSCGYDFFSPIGFTLEPNDMIKIPTGIRCEMYDGWMLMGFPRSSLGFKYGARHANTVPLIDCDYFEADNEGHIMFELLNDSCISKTLRINKGDRFCQGVFVPFGITLDDNVTEERSGGLGSTGA